MEQQIVKDVGLFARASWNNGPVGRPLGQGQLLGTCQRHDRARGAVDGLSSAHGDGRLNYRPEQVLDTYYAYAIDKSFTFTATINSSQTQPTTPTAGRFPFC
jgi:high affinity Mn2+ porin